jgi:hypothetical protein
MSSRLKLQAAFAKRDDARWRSLCLRRFVHRFDRHTQKSGNNARKTSPLVEPSDRQIPSIAFDRYALNSSAKRWLGWTFQYRNCSFQIIQ